MNMGVLPGVSTLLEDLGGAGGANLTHKLLFNYLCIKFMRNVLCGHIYCVPNNTNLNIYKSTFKSTV